MGIVVGVATPEGSRAPLEWSMAEAAKRDVELTVLHAFRPGWEMAMQGFPAPVLDVGVYETTAKALIDQAIDLVPATHRVGVRRIHPLTTPEGAAAALVDASSSADLVVVGRREHWALPRLIGSVTHQCVHHSHCPITVVPMEWEVGVTKRIVVGVDGSEPATRALRWALEEAVLWDAELVVAHAWTTPYPVEPWGMAVMPADRDEFQHSSESLIEGVVAEALASGAPRPRSWTAETVEDASGPGLVRVATDADLLVVGSRGRGGFAALFLGSTSLQCLHHASCPVVVVP